MIKLAKLSSAQLS